MCGNTQLAALPLSSRSLHIRLRYISRHWTRIRQSGRQFSCSIELSGSESILYFPCLYATLRVGKQMAEFTGNLNRTGHRRLACSVRLWVKQKNA